MKEKLYTKVKKCNGLKLAIGFGCGNELHFTTRNNIKIYSQKKGLCYSCYSDWLTTSENGRIELMKATTKAQSPRLQLEQLTKEKKERSTLSYLLVNIRNLCHEYIRLRDKGLPCISCGSLWKDDFQAGHFYKAELYSTMRFNEHNVNGQCRSCNLFKSGNESQYRVGILNRYGKEFLSDLDIIAQTEKQTNFKWDIESLKEIRTYYKAKLKEI